jgi:hypothetical protein
VTWQLHHGKTNEMWTYCQICIIFEQKVMSVITMEMLWNQPLYKTIKDMHTETTVATWWTVTPLVDSQRNRHRNYSFRVPMMLPSGKSTNAYILYQSSLLESLPQTRSFNMCHFTYKTSLNPTHSPRLNLWEVSSLRSKFL